MRVLITNDDGVHAPGLAALMKRVAEVVLETLKGDGEPSSSQ